jgi:hypothetical protein
MLEPYTYFNFGAGWKLVVDCNKNLAYFDSSTKTWNCPTDLTFMPVWLTTDGFKIAVDTNFAPASETRYEVDTYYYLWCACTGSSFARYNDTASIARFYFQIKTGLTSVTSTQFLPTYTFYVQNIGYLFYPTFTTVPSTTEYS